MPIKTKPHLKKNNELFTSKEVAKILKIKEGTLRTWRCKNTGGPKYITVGKNSIRYESEALYNYIYLDQDITN